jgi:hypothetical protein
MESVNSIIILLSGKIFNVIEPGIFGRIVSIPLPLKFVMPLREVFFLEMMKPRDASRKSWEYKYSQENEAANTVCGRSC